MRWEQTARRDLSDGEYEVDYESEDVRAPGDAHAVRANASIRRSPGFFACTVIAGVIVKTVDDDPRTERGKAFEEAFMRPAGRDTMLSLILTEAIETWMRDSAAYRRARGLLRTFLSDKQRARLSREGEFYERGRATGNWYRFRIRDGSVIPVRETSPGRFRITGFGAYYCLHPEDKEAWQVPDVVIGQLLTMRADEREFLARANFHSTEEAEQRRRGPLFQRTTLEQIEREHESEIAAEAAAG